MAEELEQNEEQVEEEEQEEQELIFGKYKSMEEAEKGYKELEREFHASRQAQSNVEPAPDYGYVTPPAPTPKAEEPTDPSEKFYENPVEFIIQTVGQVRELERIAAANKRAALKELRSHPAFDGVRDELETQLDLIEPAYLVNPAQARQVIRAMFGERLVERTATPEKQRSLSPQREPGMPVRASLVEIEHPDSSRDQEEGSIDAEGDEVLRSLGLTSKSRAAAVKSWNTRERERRGSR